VEPISDPSKDERKRERMRPLQTAKDLLPLRKASVSDCHLYWIPVSAWPVPTREREWLLLFLAQTNTLMETSRGLRGEFFLDYWTAREVERPLLKNAIELLPFPGLARRPGAPLPKAPTGDELQEAGHGDRGFDMAKHTPTYCYWFMNKDFNRLLPLFFGHGGVSMIYLAPDPGTIPPKIPYREEISELFPGLPLEKLEAMNAATAAMNDGFLAKSKALFGVGLEDEPQYEGLPFIVPLLETADFSRQPEEERKKWFELFQFHWRESPVDRGIFLASKLDIEEGLIELLKKMKEEGHVYPLA
jgi:hypothetical protein